MASLVWLGGLAALTLTPGGGSVARIISFCLLCGERGTADALLNIALFMPLGLLLGTRRGVAFAVLAGLGTSALVELGQLLLPGRFSNMGDLAWNGLGALLGAVSAPRLRGWLLEGPPRFGPVVAVALPLVWLGGAGIVLRPAPVTSGFSFDDGASLRSNHTSGVLRPSFRQHVAHVAHAEQPLAEARMDLGADGHWMLTAKIAPPPPSRLLIPIVVVYDDEDRPIRVLGADRGDLVLWERTWTRELRLDQANHRLPSELLQRGHDGVVTVSAFENQEGLCLRVEAHRECGLGVRPARTWTLLRAREHGSEGLKLRVDLAWMLTLTALIGLVGGGALSTLVSAGAFTVAVVALPSATALVPAGWPDVLGIVLGVACGVLARPAARLVL